MRKAAAIFLCTAFLLCLLPVAALAATGSTYNDGTFQYTELADGTLSVTAYAGGGGAVEIPSSYNPGSGSMAVTTIGAGVFNGKNTVTSVMIPYGVTTINDSAFYNCDGLTSVTVPLSVTTIGYYVFAYCNLLSSVTLSNGLSVIGDYMFYDCDALTSVTIPSSVIWIGRDAFYDCDSLGSVTLSDGLTVLGLNMFEDCDSLLSITIPSSLISFGGAEFMDCSSLASVTLSNGLTTLGTNMFRNCDALTSITIPSSVRTVGLGAFYECSALSSVTLSDGLTVIGTYMFYDCDMLTSITIPSSVTSIGNTAFWSCSSLGSVTLNTGLITIGNFAFYECAALTSITIPSSVTSIGSNAFHSGSLRKVVIHNKSVTLGSGCFSVTNLAADGIYGFSGSTAQTYATGNSFPFHAFPELHFDSQGGSAVPSGYVVTPGNNVNAPGDPTYENHVFGGWYPTPACDTTAVSFPYTLATTRTLYAKWTAYPTLSYDANGGSGTAPASVIQATGTTTTVSDDSTISRTNYAFNGWNTAANGSGTRYAAGSTFTFAADTILYAQWTAYPTLSYDANGGSGSAPASVVQAAGTTTTVSDGSTISRTNYVFNGWNTAANGSGTRFAAGSTFTFAADTILYAQWTAKPVLAPSTDGGKGDSGTVYSGGRITLTPSIAGGTWTYDEAFLSRQDNTFKTLKPGTTTVTYTVEGQSVTYEITIKASELPSTGQNFTWAWALACAAALILGAAVVLVRRRTVKDK